MTPRASRRWPLWPRHRASLTDVTARVRRVLTSRVRRVSFDEEGRHEHRGEGGHEGDGGRAPPPGPPARADQPRSGAQPCAAAGDRCDTGHADHRDGPQEGGHASRQGHPRGPRRGGPAGGGDPSRTPTLAAVLGWDVSGVVAEISPASATTLRPGDEVFGMPLFPREAGAHAELVAAPARHFAPKPAGLTHQEAAALPLAGLTAWQALVDTAEVQPG